MQIVIDIPESILNTIQADEMISREQLAVLQMHILNGTPLPKGHGRLIDVDDKENLTICFDDRGIIKKIEAPTIIEADTESDHKCHTCKHYTSGENDGSCGSYICKGYSNWKSEEQDG